MKITFIRTSTNDQFPKDQINPIEKEFKLKSDDYILISEHQSAFKEEKERYREGLKEMKKLIKQGNITDLYIFHLNRLFRNYKKQIAFIEFLKFHNVNLHSVRQKYFEDILKAPHPWNEILYDMLIKIYADMAERESADKSANVKKSVKQKNGVTISNRGKKWGRQEVKHDYKTLLQVKKMKEQGYSIRIIAEQLGIKKNQVEKIIKQPSENTPLEKCNLFINKFAVQDSPTKEQLTDKIQ